VKAVTRVNWCEECSVFSLERRVPGVPDRHKTATRGKTRFIGRALTSTNAPESAIIGSNWLEFALITGDRFV